MIETLGYISLFFVGLVLGTLGGGGSILSVPILVYLFAIDAVLASAYSLFIVGTTSLVGTFLRLNTKLVDYRIGLSFGLPSLLAIFSTRKWLVPAIPDVIWQAGEFQLSKRALILGLFAILMILASRALILRKTKTQAQGRPLTRIYLVVVGLMTGVLTGLVGAGGGFLILPALVYLARLDFKSAVGTTLLIITTNSLIGFLGDVVNYPINWQFLSSITVLAIVGIMVGTRLTLSISSQVLRRSFGWFIMSMGIFILVKEMLV